MPENEFRESMTVHEASDYWDEHDFDEYDDAHEVNGVTFELSKKKYVGINLPLFSLISQKAKEMHMSEEALIAKWLGEKVGNEAFEQVSG